jgi:hypothetical protein
MKSMVLLVIFVIIVAVTAGIIVVHLQGTHACVTYYTKEGSQQLNKACK